MALQWGVMNIINIAQGDLVSDDIVNELLKKVITNYNYRNRIIFDGYPRNINQAESLEIMLNGDNQSVNFVLFLKVTQEIIEKRREVKREKRKKLLEPFVGKNAPKQRKTSSTKEGIFPILRSTSKNLLTFSTPIETTVSPCIS